MGREILLSVDSEHNIVGSFDKIYEEDKEIAQWYMEKVKSPSEEIYKAKWTANGLIYTHKMNAKGEFEPIEHNVEDKAEAFDIILSTICGNPLYHLTLESDYCDNKFYLRVSLDYEDKSYEISQEQYEILKKAGIE